MTSTEFTGSGTDDLLRAALTDKIEEIAVKQRIPVAMPVKQILEALYTVIPNLPRTPNYDDELAAEQVWSSSTVFSLTELSDDPAQVGVRYNGVTGAVRIRVLGQGEETLELELDQAEGFALGVLAAVQHGRRERQRPAH